MSYAQRHSADPSLSVDGLRAFAALIDLPLEPDQEADLASAVENQLESIGSLARLDLGDVQPMICFDPRWHD